MCPFFRNCQNFKNIGSRADSNSALISASVSNFLDLVAIIVAKQKTRLPNRRQPGLDHSGVSCRVTASAVTSRNSSDGSGGLAGCCCRVPLCDECGSARTACPWHYSFFLGGCCDDTFDEACVGFHGFDPLPCDVRGDCPCLRTTMTLQSGGFLAWHRLFGKKSEKHSQHCGEAAPIQQRPFLYGASGCLWPIQCKIQGLFPLQNVGIGAARGRDLPQLCPDQRVITAIRRP